jgi:hypothetical protein
VSEVLIVEIGGSHIRVHELKTAAESFDAIDLRLKKAEVRLNDRDYQPGDLLALRRLDDTGAIEPGSPLVMRVTHVFQGGRFGLEQGYVLLSLGGVSLQELRAVRDHLAAVEP